MGNTRDMLYEQAKAVSDSIKTIVGALDQHQDCIDQLAIDNGIDQAGEQDFDYDDLAWLHDYLMDYPLEVVDQRGREYAVVISTGGPHIEVVADGDHDARLEGYWGGEQVTLTGEYLSTFLDYYIDRD